MILALQTDAAEARVMIIGPGGEVMTQHTWHAHRTLARDILTVIKDQLTTAGGDWNSLSGLICFSGPGSFTGLRIGAAVINTITQTNQVPVVAVNGSTWIEAGLRRLAAGENDRVVMPTYGAAANITSPKK